MTTCPNSLAVQEHISYEMFSSLIERQEGYLGFDEVCHHLCKLWMLLDHLWLGAKGVFSET